MITATKNIDGSLIDIAIPEGEAFYGSPGPSRLSVPVDPTNSAYVEFLALDIEPGEWVAPPATVPASVTLAQARVALRRAGKFSAADTAIKAAGGEALDAWEYGNQISRSSPLVASMATALGLTEAQVDGLFVVAGSIEF